MLKSLLIASCLLGLACAFHIPFTSHDDPVSSGQSGGYLDRARDYIPGMHSQNQYQQEADRSYFPEQKGIFQKTKDSVSNVLHKAIPEPEESISPYEQARSKVGFGGEVQHLDRATADHAAAKLQECAESVAYDNILHAQEACEEANAVLRRAYETASRSTRGVWQKTKENAAMIWQKTTGSQRLVSSSSNVHDQAVDKIRMAAEDLVIGNVIGAHDNAADAADLLRYIYEHGTDQDRSYWDTAKSMLPQSFMPNIFGGGKPSGKTVLPSVFNNIMNKVFGIPTTAAYAGSRAWDIAKKLPQTAMNALPSMPSFKSGSNKPSLVSRLMPAALTGDGGKTIPVPERKLNNIQDYIHRALEHVSEARELLDNASQEVGSASGTRASSWVGRQWRKYV